ncbi:MAG: zf-HC2 domain-containing protein [Chloroflexi bacterium]|nr:zf-HC2 domain-containing protein [Chloroflexota bacterium]
MALDEVAEASVWQHLEQCPYCRDRLEKARKTTGNLEARLKKAVFRLDCPPSQAFVEYLFNRLAPTEHASMKQHLEICPHCQHDLADLRQFMQASMPVEPKPKRKSPYGEIIATLSSALGPKSPLAAGFRGDSSGFLFEAEGITIFLSVQTQPTGRHLMGQVLATDSPSDWAGSLVELRQVGELKATAFIDENGRFICPLLVGEPVELRVTNSHNQSILVKGIEFKE